MKRLFTVLTCLTVVAMVGFSTGPALASAMFQDDFTLARVPEPSSIALLIALAIGGLALRGHVLARKLKKDDA